MTDTVPMDEGARRFGLQWRRRIARWLLLIGLALMILHTFQGRPFEIEVRYDFGEAREGLVQAQMVYFLGDEEVHRVRFDYTSKPPGEAQNHTVKLPKGDYRVAVELTYRAEPPGSVAGERRRASGGQWTVEMNRPLIVRGAGQSVIYLSRVIGGS